MKKNTSGSTLLVVFLVLLAGVVFYLRARNPEAFAKLETDLSTLVGSPSATPPAADTATAATSPPASTKKNTQPPAPGSVAANPSRAIPTKLALPAIKAANAAARKASDLADGQTLPPPTPSPAPKAAPPIATPGITAQAATEVGGVATQATSDTINAPAPETTTAPATFSTPQLASPAAATAAPAWTPPKTLPVKPNWDWTTTDGHTYKNVKILKVEPDNVTILYEDGGAHIPLSTLSPDLQKMLNYDPDAAAQWAVPKLLEGNLVSLNGAALQPVNDSTLPPIKYFAIYYSAQWCPPCHLFTPKLVQFYNDFKPAHPNFELIFISEDHNPAAMLAYMKEMKMPWLAFKFDQLMHPNGTFKAPGIEDYANKGIPDLVLVDSTGKVLSDSYYGDHYVGPEAVVDDIKTMVQ